MRGHAAAIPSRWPPAAILALCPVLTKVLTATWLALLMAMLQIIIHPLILSLPSRGMEVVEGR
jgi:hypothetical protein